MSIQFPCFGRNLLLIFLSTIFSFSVAAQQPCPPATNINVSYNGPSSNGLHSYQVTWDTSPLVLFYTVEVTDLNNNVVYSTSSSSNLGTATIFTSLDAFYIIIGSECLWETSPTGITTIIDVPVNYYSLCHLLTDMQASGQESIIVFNGKNESTTYSLFEFCLAFCVSPDLSDLDCNDFKKQKRLESAHPILNIPSPISNDEAKITYFLAESSPISLSIYNQVGKKVRLISSKEIKDGGAHQVKVNLNGLPQGVYVIELKTEHAQITQRFIKVN
ncbi:MAG: T9SS type A sorting domain-containing protein [Bacteroidota bacterium]